MRARLKRPPHPVVARELFAKGLETDRGNFEHAMRVNVVHALLLLQGGALTREQARSLAKLYRDMLAGGVDAISLDSNLEDLHFNIEAHVIRQLGTEIGGRMHTGRSRNDLNATTARMQTRERLLTLAERANRLRRSLVDHAQRHAGSVMTGYTHLQPAQPITFGYYLLAVADALCRDFKRIVGAYSTTNQSPLGAAALAGSSYPLERTTAAALLGFDGVVENALDAVASRDYMLELLAGCAGFTVTLSRLAQDLQVWASDEFSLVEFDDDVCIVSSVMPQKKNPITLEHCKGKAGQVVGHLVAALMATHSTAFTNTRDVNREVPTALGQGLTQAEASIDLMDATLAGMTARPDRMLNAARSNFSTVTELADMLVRDYGIPFRSAHEVVAGIVIDAIDRGERSDGITAASVVHHIRRVTGLELSVPEDKLRAALEPENVIAARVTQGSPSPEQVRLMIDRASAELERDADWIVGRRQALEDAALSVANEVDRLLRN